jgi:hypothetical protein
VASWKPLAALPNIAQSRASCSSGIPRRNASGEVTHRRLPRSRTPLLGPARNQSALRRSRLGVRLLSSRLRSLLQPTRRNKPTPPEEHLAKNEGTLALAWPM